MIVSRIPYITALKDSHQNLNQNTPKEIKLIQNLRHRNSHADLVIFWTKLQTKGYKRSIPRLYRFLRRPKLMSAPPPPKNPKYVPKPYEAMLRPNQRIQIDVKFVSSVHLSNLQISGEKFYQYTAIDKFSRWQFVETFEGHNTYSSAFFLEHLIKVSVPY